MSLFKDAGVALRRFEYSETSQILVFFTREHGKQRLIAKGIKRGTRQRVAPGIDLLESGEVIWSRKDEAEATLGILTDWRQTDAFTPLRSKLARLYAGQYAAEIVHLLTEDGDPHAVAYDCLVEMLSALCAAEEALGHVVTFQAALLREVGLMPDFGRCVRCDKVYPGRGDAYLSSGEGGLVCRNCEPTVVEKRRVAQPTIVGLTDGNWAAEGQQGAFGVLDYHIECLIGRPTKLGSFVERTSA